MTPLMIISNFYGSKRAKRSRQLLLTHVIEGANIISEVIAELGDKCHYNVEALKGAFLIHPIIQHPDDLDQNIYSLVQSLLTVPNNQIILDLALSYRMLANSYLCTEYTDTYTDKSLIEIAKDYPNSVKLMLLADKLQNYHHFILFNSSHARAEQLEIYFDRWIRVMLEFLEEEFGQINYVRKLWESYY